MVMIGEDLNEELKLILQDVHEDNTHFLGPS